MLKKEELTARTLRGRQERRREIPRSLPLAPLASWRFSLLGGVYQQPAKTAPVKDRIGDLVARLSGWAIAHARLVMVLSWVVAIACGLLAAQLDVFGDFSNLLPPDAESV